MAACAVGEILFRPEDWWNGQIYLATQIAAMARAHRTLGNTYPEALSPEEWKDILLRIEEPLVAFVQGIDDLDGSVERTAAAREALHLFAEWFDHLWD